MKIRIALALLPALMLGCTADEPAEPQGVSAPETPQNVEELVTEAPQLMSEVFENEHVRAMLVRLQPGAEVPEHGGRERVAFSLTDYRILFTEDGESSQKDWRTGQAHWHQAGDHAVRNIGESEARFLVVTRTDSTLSDAGDLHADHDPPALEEGFASLVLENERVRVTQVSLPPGAAQTAHHGLHRLIYSLSGYEVRYTSDQVDAVERGFVPGDVHWHEPDRHAVENIGATEARFVVFQFKD